MVPERGRSLPLSLPRRWIGDLTYASRHVPLVSLARRMDLARVADARARVSEPPGWCALFTCAFARVAAARPEFRRCYLSLPRRRLYEHARSVASVAVEREFNGEPAVFFGLIRDPAHRDVAEVEARIRSLADDPIRTNNHYRRLVRLTRCPLPLRRALWSVMLHWSGPVAARNAGTFGISATASLGGAAVTLISPLAYTLSYAPIDARGSMEVRCHFDHRVVDGAPVARGLAHLETMLNTEIAAELSAIRGVIGGHATAPRSAER